MSVSSLQNRNVLLQYWWSIYCPDNWKFHSEKQRLSQKDNWLFSQSPKVACLRGSCNLRASCSLSASLQCLPPDALPRQEQWALLQARQWSLPALVPLLFCSAQLWNRFYSFFHALICEVRRYQELLFFIKCVFSPLWCWQWSSWDSIKWPWEWSWACWEHCSSSASRVKFFFSNLLGENSWTVFTDL